MNAQALFTQDGKATGVWFCSTCRIISKDQQIAEKCCHPVLCECCGNVVQEKHWLVCSSCREAKRIVKERVKFEAAEKVPESEHSGWIYSEGHGGNEGYFQDVADFHDWFANDADEEQEKPLYVWDCTPQYFVKIDMGDVMGNFDGHAWEDFDEHDLSGVAELKTALAAFEKANESVCSYQPNYKRAIVLKSE